MFTGTVNSLKSVNTEIEETVAQKEERIKAEQAEVDTLNNVKATNSKLAAKIEEFLTV